jgi:hypothetical protein
MMLVEMNPGKMQSEECRAALEMALAEAANMKEVVIPPGRVYHLSVTRVLCPSAVLRCKADL